MSDRNIEQRIVIKFLVKLGKNGSETLEMLKKVYGEETMSRARVFGWHKRFKDGREDAHDNKKSGRPPSATTNENIERIRELIRQDRQISVQLIAKQLNINKETVRKILKERLGKKIVPRNDSTIRSKRKKAKESDENLEKHL